MRACGWGDSTRVIDDVIANVQSVIDVVATKLPKDFPGWVFERVAHGMLEAAHRL